MKPADLIIENAAQILTLSPGENALKAEEKLGIVTNGSIAIAKGRIVWVGPDHQISQQIDLSGNPPRIDASGKIVLPGLIDSHTHLVFAGTREKEFELRLQGATYQEIAAKGGGIKSTVQKTRQASKEELFQVGKKHLDQMLSLGTTTVEAKSGYGLSTKDEIKMLEVLRDLDRAHFVDVVPTFLGAHEIPPEYAGKKDDYVRLVIEEMIPAVAEKKLAVFCDVFCEQGVFSPGESRRILEAGKRCGLEAKIHADELTSLGGAELAAELGAASADHLLFASDKGIESLADKGVVATLLPGTAFFLFLGRYAPARKMIEKGVTVALASDFNPGSCMTPSLPLITTMACTQMRMTPAEAILGITLHAAKALKKEGEIGSLEAGKQADLVILDIPDYRHLSYYFGVNHMWKVIKKGIVSWEG
ncbi:MAG: imidazolonepropionase [Deltaproteobacteria bacterium]|nr:MAG: imidazolonepropionase [Deltaproteobacteria bacterium]